MTSDTSQDFPDPDTTHVDASESAIPLLTGEQEEAVALLESSGIFSLDWYQLQRGREFTTAREALVDFVSEGARLDLAPHPLFSHAWIVRDQVGEQHSLDVLMEYLKDGDYARRTSTHPLFDPQHLEGRFQSAANPLAAFLQGTTRDSPLPYDAATSGLPEGITLRQVEEAATTALQNWTRHAEHLPGAVPAHGPGLSVEDLPPVPPEAKATFVVVLENSPNDFRTVYEHIAGPRAVQRFGAWEMLILDPYRVEDADLVVGHIAKRDSRVRYLPTEARTLAGALAESVSAVTGTAVIFTDPSLVWESAFTRSAVAAIESGVTAVRSADVEGRPFFSRMRDATLPGLVISAEALRRAEVDPALREATVVDLLDQVMEGEGLPAFLEGPDVGARTVAALPVPAECAPLEHAVITDRWAAREAAPREEGTAALVLLGLTPGTFEVVGRTAAEFADVDSPGTAPEDSGDAARVETLLIAETADWHQVALFSTLTLAAHPVTVVSGSTNRARLLDVAVWGTRAETLVLALPEHELLPGGSTWIEVVREVAETGRIVHPLVMDDHGAITDAGSFYPTGSLEPALLLAGRARNSVDIAVRTEVPSAGIPVVARTADIRTAGGFSPQLDDLWLVEDLVRRIPGATVELRTDVLARTAGRVPLPPRDRATALQYFRQGWGEQSPPAADALLDSWDVTPIDSGTAAWADASHSDAWGAHAWIDGRLRVTERPSRSTWLVLPRRTGSDLVGSAGAVEFAESLAQALRAQGQTAVVQDPRSIDWTLQAQVVVDLDGTISRPLPSGARKVLWVTDNMDRVDLDRLAGFDLVYAAAPRWAEKVTATEGVGVEPLYLCTDPEAFRFDAGSPFSRTARVVSVGERKPWRQVSVHGTIQNLHSVQHFRAYGDGWTGQIPPQFIAPAPSSTKELAELYRTAFYVPVDHRPELRDLGFVSSQVFDVLSCGGHLLVDDVHGLHDLFGGHVARYRSWVELGWAYGLEWVCFYPTPEGQERLSAEIAEKHSFAARARRLIADVDSIASERAS